MRASGRVSVEGETRETAETTPPNPPPLLRFSLTLSLASSFYFRALCVFVYGVQTWADLNSRLDTKDSIACSNLIWINMQFPGQTPTPQRVVLGAGGAQGNPPSPFTLPMLACPPHNQVPLPLPRLLHTRAWIKYYGIGSYTTDLAAKAIAALHVHNTKKRILFKKNKRPKKL